MKDSKTDAGMRPAELAKLSGVSTDTLRHYERLRLLQAGRSSNGYREYPAGSVERVRLVQNALNVGFSLEELARVLKVREKGGTPCREVRLLTANKLREVEDRIQGLGHLKKALGDLLKAWDATLARTKNNEQARLLDMLAVFMPVERLATRRPLRGKGKST